MELSPLLSAVVVVWGLVTAAYAAICARVQTDIKSALAFAALTQVGIIVAEIGLGLRYLALAHLIGHACLRTLQLVRAPSLMHDYRLLENAIGASLGDTGFERRHWLPQRARVSLWRLGSERGYLDAILNDLVVQPLLDFFHHCDCLERRWTDWVTGAPSRESDRVAPAVERTELTIIDETDLASLGAGADSRSRLPSPPLSEPTAPAADRVIHFTTTHSYHD